MAKSVRTDGEKPGRRTSDRRRKTDEQAATVESTQTTAAGVRASLDALSKKAVGNGPTRQDIARRAYEIYLRRGGTHGYDIEDWLQAEQELARK